MAIIDYNYSVIVTLCYFVRLYILDNHKRRFIKELTMVPKAAVLCISA